MISPPRIPLAIRGLTVAACLTFAASLLPTSPPASALAQEPRPTSTTQLPTTAWSIVPLPNRSFRRGFAQWRVSGSKTVRLVVQGHADKRALALATPGGEGVSVQPKVPAVESGAPGATYRASAWVRSTAGASAILRLGEAGDHSRLAVTRKSLEPRSGWHRVVVSYQATSSGSINLRFTAAGLRTNESVFVDDVKLEMLRPNDGTSDVAHASDSDVTADADRERSWLSGAAGERVTDGQFGSWRDSTVDIVGTWNDNFESQEKQWSLRPGFSYGDWQGNIDVAVGAIYKDRGETWAAAAAGAYDARWRNALKNIAFYRDGKPGTVYVRFAHEFNGDWFPWSVTGAEVADFKGAWIRFAAMFDEILPQAKLVFCPNTETTSSLNLDWRTAFPGSAFVDVLAVDMYNQWPFVTTEQEFASNILTNDRWGAPKGLEQHRRFAESNGLPFALAEWSSNAEFGDSPIFIQELHDWMVEHGGDEPGELLYEILFNVGNYGSGQYELFPETDQPSASEMYRTLW